MDRLNKLFLFLENHNVSRKRSGNSLDEGNPRNEVSYHRKVIFLLRENLKWQKMPLENVKNKISFSYILSNLGDKCKHFPKPGISDLQMVFFAMSNFCHNRKNHLGKCGFFPRVRFTTRAMHLPE